VIDSDLIYDAITSAGLVPWSCYQNTRAANL